LSHPKTIPVPIVSVVDGAPVPNNEMKDLAAFPLAESKLKLNKSMAVNIVSTRAIYGKMDA